MKGAPKDVVQEHANNSCDSAPNAVTTEKSTARKINARDKKKKKTELTGCNGFRGSSFESQLAKQLCRQLRRQLNGQPSDQPSSGSVLFFNGLLRYQPVACTPSACTPYKLLTVSGQLSIRLTRCRSVPAAVHPTAQFTASR